MVICIDFQGGSHGNFLEFVCNKFMAGITCTTDTPFSANGASHHKIYLSPRIFFANHYYVPWYASWPDNCEKVISIRISVNDLLPLSAISLLRAGDYGFDNNELEIDTYHKFNNIHYRSTLDNLIASFFTNQIKGAYYAVKDPSWPKIENDEEFDLLPPHIKLECLTYHGINPIHLNEDYPNCPRYILREFFKIGFRDPEKNGFLARQRDEMNYDRKYKVFNFEFGAFYNTSQFLEQVDAISQFVDLPVIDWQGIVELHQQFLERQPYKDLKTITDDIYQQVIDGKSIVFGSVNLLQESYLDAKFEAHYGKEAPSKNTKWFMDGDQVRQYYGGK